MKVIAINGSARRDGRVASKRCFVGRIALMALGVLFFSHAAHAAQTQLTAEETKSLPQLFARG